MVGSANWKIVNAGHSQRIAINSAVGLRTTKNYSAGWKTANFRVDKRVVSSSSASHKKVIVSPGWLSNDGDQRTAHVDQGKKKANNIGVACRITPADSGQSTTNSGNVS